MKYRIEIANVIEDMPIRLFLENIEQEHYRCDMQISMILIMKGEICIHNDDMHVTLKQGDLFLINSNVLYSIDSLHANQVYVMQIEGKYFNHLYVNFDKLQFRLNSTEEDDKTAEYNRMKSRMVKLLDILMKKKNGYLLTAKQLLLEVIISLVDKFVEYSHKEEATLNQDQKRIKDIIEFIFTHYKEKIGLKDIADYLNLNPQYISRYFSKQMGTTLNAFITKIRLEESIKQLSSTDQKITNIAMDHGFPNLKSYFKAFKETFDMTPSKYRRDCMKVVNNNLELDFSKFDIKDSIVDSSYGDQLFSHMNITNVVDCTASGGFLDKTWKKIMAFGRASEGMREELRNQLRMLQKDITFEYVRFHGIFSDEMMVYTEDSMGNPEYNFTYVDELLDFLLEIKLKPFIEVGFMPEQLASQKKHLFLWKANISFPKDMRKWTELVRNFVLHLVERYGMNEVQTWYFQIWNHVCIGYPQVKDYFDFIKHTFHAVKGINSQIKVGGTINVTVLKEFIVYEKTEYFELDFIAFVEYSIINNIEDEENSFSDKYTKTSESQYILQNTMKYCSHGEKDYISIKVDEFIEVLRKNGIEAKEIFLTEWNSTPNPKDLLHDTCFKAAFLVKNILDNFHKVNGMAYWSISDIFEEIKTNNATFHGGVGIITNNGVKKPIYYAYQLMNKLGNEIVTKGECFIVTKKQNGSFQILVYNYCDFIASNINCDQNETSMEERYNVFYEKILDFCLLLKGLMGRFQQKIYRINKESGSAFDEWLKIGAPKIMTTEEINYIKNKSIYSYYIDEVYVEGNFRIHHKLQPHEVLLIELLPL